MRKNTQKKKEKQEKIKIDAKMVKLAEEVANELLTLMGTKARAEAKEDGKNDTIKIDIETEEEKGLLIGRHGETIEAMQAAIALMLKQKTDSWVRLIVNVGDWREKQEERLRELAVQAAERAKETGEEQHLYNLTPAQRRVIHLALAKEPGIETESTGEDRERYLVVRTKR